MNNIEKIAELFPECITESRDSDGKLTRAINFAVLKDILSENISTEQEHYKFTWVGKSQARALAQKKIDMTLRPCKDDSVDWDTTQNLYIEGDNLDVLKVLLESYLHKVKMIYIDPPYNTGNDFIYRDNFTMDEEKFSAQINLFDDEGNKNFKQNSNSNPRFHSDWCSMIYSRLLVARNFLTDDGVIFISIDDNEQANLKKICNEVFGERNFVAQFIWKSKLGKVGTTSLVSATHEYIICYAKNIFETKFKMIETETGGRKENLRQWGQADRREDRPSMYYPIKIDDVEIYPIKEDGTEGRWRVGEETAKKLLKNGELELVNKNGKYSIYRRFAKGKSISTYETFLNDMGATADGARILKTLNLEKYFNYSKPIKLIKFLLQIATDEDSIIMDFFSGSATTAHAVMQLNAEDGGRRKFIMVQLPEPCNEKSEAFKAGYKNICEIGKERIRRAGAKIKSDAPLTTLDLDVGFRVFKLDTTNMRDVSITPAEFTKEKLLDLLENIKSDRTALDLLFEHLLKCGVEISKPYTEENFNGYTIHNYNDGEFIACFDKNITREVVEHIAKKKPRRALFRDHCFKKDSDKINTMEIFKYYAPNTRLKVI